MTYIIVEIALPRHRKTLRLARRLGVPNDHAVGLLVSLWAWAVDAAPPEGGPLELDDVLAATDWRKDGTRLGDALVEVGFLDRRDDGLWLHDWPEHSGRIHEQRKAARDRKAAQRSRERHADVSQGRHGDTGVTSQSGVRGNQAELRSVDPISPPTPPLLVELHSAVHELLGGAGAPDPGWCSDLIGRGLERSDIDHAIQESIRLGKRSMPYLRKILEGRIADRAAGRLTPLPDRPSPALDQPERAHMPHYDPSPNGRAVS